LKVGTQCADVNKSLNAGFFHGAGDLAWQIHVDVFKAFFAAMQHCHQIHHRIVTRHQPGQIDFAVHRGFNDRQSRQALHTGRIHGAAGGHCDVPAHTGQLLADVAANKAAAPQNQNALCAHAALKPLTAWCMASMA
jgi:hypothetical protein